MVTQVAVEQAKRKIEDKKYTQEKAKEDGDRWWKSVRDYNQAVYRIPEDPRKSMRFVAKDGEIFERDEETKQLSTTPMSVQQIMDRNDELSADFRSSIEKGRAVSNQISAEIEAEFVSRYGEDKLKEIKERSKKAVDEQSAKWKAEWEERRKDPKYIAAIEAESARRMEAAHPTNSLSRNSLLSRATGRPAHEIARSEERTAAVIAQSERAGEMVRQGRERDAEFLRNNREYLRNLREPDRRPLFREFVEYYKNNLLS